MAKRIAVKRLGVWACEWDGDREGGSFPLPARSDRAAAVAASSCRRLFPWLRRCEVRAVWHRSASSRGKGVVVASWRAVKS